MQTPNIPNNFLCYSPFEEANNTRRKTDEHYLRFIMVFKLIQLDDIK